MFFGGCNVQLSFRFTVEQCKASGFRAEWQGDEAFRDTRLGKQLPALKLTLVGDEVRGYLQFPFFWGRPAVFVCCITSSTLP